MSRRSISDLLIVWGLAGIPAIAWAQTKPAHDTPAVIVQPGAPGRAGKILTAEAASIKVLPPSAADIAFMQGMIMHHSQAVEMTALLSARGADKELQTLGQRISISQTDEMKYMKQWLADRGQPVSAPVSGGIAGMDHSKMDGMKMDSMKMDSMDMGSMDMGSMGMMPGMLTAAQMKELGQASGAAFDHLFLTGMIQHHNGALTMVQDLFNTAGAGQDAVLFDFATDVDNTQRAEIQIMQGMLLKEKK